MQFREGIHVYSADKRDVGHIERVVMNPITKEVTHVVVQQGVIFSEDKVIPVELFQSATGERAVLREDIDDLQALPRFEETHYVPIGLEEEGVENVETSTQPVYWYPPVGLAPSYAPTIYGASEYSTAGGRHYIRRVEQNIPEDTIALEEGAKVFSVDGEHIGDIERVFVDPESDYATHILISHGLLLKEKKVVPTLWFSTVEEGEVHLAVPRRILDRLPEFKVE